MWGWTSWGFYGFRCWRFEQPENRGSNITDQEHWHHFFHEMRFRKWDTQVQTASKTASNCKELWDARGSKKTFGELHKSTIINFHQHVSLELSNIIIPSRFPKPIQIVAVCGFCSGLLVPLKSIEKSCTNCSSSIETIHHGEDESRTGTFMVPSLQSQHTIVIYPVTGFHSPAP